jgi:hypothetical protein
MSAKLDLFERRPAIVGQFSKGTAHVVGRECGPSSVAVLRSCRHRKLKLDRNAGWARPIRIQLWSRHMAGSLKLLQRVQRAALGGGEA